MGGFFLVRFAAWSRKAMACDDQTVEQAVHMCCCLAQRRNRARRWRAKTVTGVHVESCSVDEEFVRTYFK